MQIQHIDIVVSSFESLQEGEFGAPVGSPVDHLVPIIGSSEVWDAWVAPSALLADLGAFSLLCVQPVLEDSQNVKLTVSASAPDKKIGLRVYVLSR